MCFFLNNGKMQHSSMVNKSESGNRLPGISVVIPAFQRVEQLLCAVESVRAKKNARVEILVIDDCSPEPLKLNLPCVNSSGVRVREFRLHFNRGPQAARNLGIRRAFFSHIAFLDSDDTFEPDKIDAILFEIDMNSPDVIFHDVHGMEKYGSLARLWSYQLSGIIPFHWWASLLNPVVTPALVVKRRISLGLPALRHCEDWFYLLRYLQPAMQVRYLDRKLTRVYRAQGSHGGLSSAVWKMRVGEFRARMILLKNPTVSGVSRFLLGALAGFLRILNDFIRLRYR